MNSETCPICLEYVDLTTLDCNHNFCPECLVKYIQTELNDDESEILCPCDSCTQTLDYDTISKILSKNNYDILKTYDNLLDELKEKQGKKVSICVNCNVVCKKNKESNKVYCRGCDSEFCYICKEYHYDYNYCENSTKINNTLEEIKSALDNQNIKLCPVCKIIMYKEEGCSSVKCKYCRIKFCWKCLQMAHNINKFENHNCDEYYDEYHHTTSDDEYQSGGEYSSDSD
jgi:IBR (half RING finger) domain-containing protein/RING finger family protein